MNQAIGVALVLIDRNGQKLGLVHLVTAPLEDRLAAECRLGPELIKNSYVSFQVHPNTENVKLVKLVLGDHKALRRVGGRVVYEAIK